MSLPIRLDYIKQVVGDQIAAGVSDLPPSALVWASKKGTPRVARPFMSMQILSGPFSDMGKEERRFREVLDSVTVTVDTATVGERYRFRVNGFPVDYTAIGGDGVTEIRDGLLANAQAATNYLTGEDVTLSTNGSDSIDIVPDSVGELTSILLANVSLSKAETSSDAWVMYQVAQDRMVVQVTAFDAGANDEEALSAKMMARKAMKFMDSPESIEEQLSTKVGIQLVSDITDLTSVEPGGANFQGQSQFDIQVTASSLSISPVNPIDSVVVTIDISGNTQTFTTP